MAMSDPLADEAFRVLVDSIEAAWDDGCPVAGSDPATRAEVARRAIRRWGSATRRGVDPDRLVEDLAVGLITAFEPKPELVGPLARDYDYLATRIATVLRGHQADG
jgi:hypothetical protein